MRVRSMPDIRIVKLRKDLLPERAAPRWVCAPLLLLALCLLPPARAADAPPSRGAAQVAVMTNLTSTNPTDVVTIRLVAHRDKDVLLRLASTLGDKFGNKPLYFSFEEPDPTFVADKGIGLNFQLPVVPRNEGYLPIAPFIETFAPYASRLRILYYVQGPFTYRGYQHYQHPDVSFNVMMPDPGPQTSVPLAFYGVDVMIKNPSLTTMTIPNYPTTPGTKKSRGIPVFILFALAIVIGVSGGVLLVMLIAQWKAADAARHGGNSGGGQHE